MQDRVLNILWIDAEPAGGKTFLSLFSKQKDCPLNIVRLSEFPSDENLSAVSCEFDVILLDISMPAVLSSGEFERMRDRFPLVPVILLVGPDREIELKQILLEGAQDYLLKERLDSETLLRALRYAAEWKKSAGELVRKNSELEAVFGVLPDLYFRINLDGVILDYKAKRVSELYVPPEFFLGKRAEEILPAEVARKLRQALDRLRETREPAGVEYWLPVNGREQYFEAKLFLLSENEAAVLVKNITEEKKALDELRKDARLYRLLAESTQDSIFVVNGDGCVQYVNEIGARQFGRPSGEILGRKITELFPEETSRRQMTNLRTVFETGTIGTFEGKVVFPGEEIWLSTVLIPIKDSEQRVEAVMGISRNITARKKAEESLRENENRYRGLVESQQDLIVRVDPEGRFTFVNDAYCRKFGKTREELLGKNFSPLVHPDDLPGTLEAMKALETPPYRAYLEQRALTAEGWRWIGWEDCAIRDEQNRPVEIQGVGRDITERRQTEEALRYRLEFEKLVTTLSTKFINLSPDEIDSEVNYALQEIGKFVDADRSYIFQFLENDTIMDNVYEWCKEGVEPEIQNLKNIRAMDLPWLYRKITSLETVHIPKVADLPQDANAEREHFESQGIHSLVVVPMVCGGDLVGFLGFDSVTEERTWTEDAVALLKIMGEIFASALERKMTVERFKYIAYHDSLTDLPNRILFIDRLNQAIISARRYRQHVGLILLDLDHFKRVNDTLGHALGDQLLQMVAERLQKTLQETDTVTRLGSDEYAILVPKIGPTEDMVKIADKIYAALKIPFYVGGHELFMSCSMGISFYPSDGKEGEVLLRNADAAMYRAKNHGRNNYQLYSSAMNARAFERLVLETSLRHALERAEFRVYYQPQVDLRTGMISGTEALVRWQHPTLGLVSPAEFIPLAEENGFIVELGEWVLHAACTQNKVWQRQGFLPMTVSVNLSARQFQSGNLAKMIRRVLRETELEPAYLELELTEGTIMENVEETVEILRELKKMGVKISVDDFGIGYCSLGYLSRFPINALKIDKSFMRDFSTEANHAAIAGAIISMAHGLKLEVIAEGVETQQQLAFLRGKSCDKMQGYLFSKPVPPESFSELLLEGRGPLSREGFSA